MRNKVERFLRLNCRRRKKFQLVELEDFLIREYGGQTGYYDHGGYRQLARVLKELEFENIIREIKSSPLNGKIPPLKTRWIKVSEKIESAWKEGEIFRLSDLLDLSYYLNHPQEQTEKEWQRILSIYRFLQEREKREWASLEERSLELFGDEKFLSGKGRNKDNRILSRLGLTPEDLKARKYGQMFVYWNKGVKEIKEILILENHSTFFSFKRAIAEGIAIFDLNPDALIFGQGKRIIKSLSFLEEIADPGEVKLYYFGDIDPEGFLIYHSLKEKYPGFELGLHLLSYSALIKAAGRDFPCEQKGRREDLEFVLSEFREGGYLKEAGEITRIWNSGLRIPQELITYEYLLKLKDK